MGKRKAADANDEKSEAAFSDASSEVDRPLKQKKTSKSIRKRTSKVVSNSEEEIPNKKKSEVKAKKPARYKEASPEGSAEESESNIIVKSNNEGDKYVELGRKRRATVRAFKGKPLLDIREYYGQEDDENPGKKGIALSQDEWEKLKQNASTIDMLFKKVRR